jgi:hypothetical protein
MYTPVLQAPAGTTKTSSPTVIRQLMIPTRDQHRNKQPSSSDLTLDGYDTLVQLLQCPAAELAHECSTGVLHHTVDLAVRLKVGRWQEVQQMLPLAVHWANIDTLCSVVTHAMVDASIAAGQWVDHGRVGLAMGQEQGGPAAVTAEAHRGCCHCRSTRLWLHGAVQYGGPYPSVGCVLVWRGSCAPSKSCMQCTVSDSASLSDDPRDCAALLRLCFLQRRCMSTCSLISGHMPCL